MALQSMTGFARREGTSGRSRWAWELRSVNGKGLDLRLRLPPGLERLETDVRKLITDRFSRGNLQVGLSLSVDESRVEAVVNQDALATVLALRGQLAGVIDPAPLRLDTLLAIRGIVEFKEAEESEEALAARDADIMAGLEAALVDLSDMRRREGQALGQILLGQVAVIETLTTTVERDPSRSPQEIAARLGGAGCHASRRDFRPRS